MKFNKLIPELTVCDIEKTKSFYIDILGFSLEYERKEDKFIFLSYEGSQLMFEEFHQSGWNVDELIRPFGRGVNFSIEVSCIERIRNCLVAMCYPLYKDIMINEYKANETVFVEKEFLVQDPDGYLLRFVQG